METKIGMEYGMVNIVKKLENFYTSRGERLEKLSEDIFQHLEGLMIKNGGVDYPVSFLLTNKSYKSKTSLFGGKIAKGTLKYDMNNGRGIPLKVGELELSLSTKKDYGKLKICLSVDKKWYDPMIIKDLTAQFKYYEFL